MCWNVSQKKCDSARRNKKLSMRELKVVEFGTYWAAPLTGQHLLHVGCNVVSIVRPAHLRSARREALRVGDRALCALRHGKTIREVDLVRDPSVAWEEVMNADVLVENFATGVMDRLGFDVATCRSRNPNLVYVSLPGFAPEDAEFVDVKAYESILLATCGVFKNMGLNRTLLGVEASYTHLPMASVYASCYATFSILCACHFSKAKPPHLVIPLASALSETLVHNSMHYCPNVLYMNQREQRVHTGAHPVTEEELDSLHDPFFRTYQCRGDRPIHLVTPAHAKHQLSVLRVLGVAFEDVVPRADTYASDVKGIGSGSLTREQSRLLSPRMRDAFRSKFAFEWELLFFKEGVPACAHRTTEEWMCGDAICNGLVHHATGALSPVAWWTDERACTSAVPLPHILPSLHGPCLSGVKVVDMTNVIAGPTQGYLLARFGASVIKVDPPSPTYAPEVSVLYGLAVNRGKRSVLLDAFSEPGRRDLVRLLKEADVLLVNSTEESLARIRLTPRDLEAINPSLILARFDAWGSPSEQGWMRNMVGYDDCVQAGIGIQSRFGRSLSEPEEHSYVGTIDVMAGICGAISVVAALARRSQKGVVSTARASLAACGQVLQFPFLHGSHRLFCGTGHTCEGEHSALRNYKTHDGWICLVAPFDWTVQEWDAACQRTRRLLAAREDGEVDCADDIPPPMDRLLSSFPSSACVQALKSVGVQAVPLRSFADMRRVYTGSDASKTFGFDRHDDHPLGTLVIVSPRCIRGMPQVNVSHAPQYGEHTHAILGNSASSPVSRWSDAYLPFPAPCDGCGMRNARMAKRFLSACEHSLCSSCTLRPFCLRCGASQDETYVACHQRRGYLRWRKGNPHGARNLERTFESRRAPPSRGLGRSHSAPPPSSFSSDAL